MLTRRTRISLAQFLERLPDDQLEALYEKCGLNWRASSSPFPYHGRLQGIRTIVEQASEDTLMVLLDEIVCTRGALRSRISPKYAFDERWTDLVRCLQLDGYQGDQQARTIRPLDPTIAAAPPVEDDLSAELEKSGLPEAKAVRELFEKSAEAFRRRPPDYNAALSEARVALETLARGIARSHQRQSPDPFDESKWGSILAYLRRSGFLTSEEEEGLAGVYGFVSPGAHRPVDTSKEEMVRLGRSLVALMLYFLVKRYNDNL